ncbi:hypothetical protein [Microbacterium sp. NIBRBAC000506063]|uniref:hypothetical protein n=1 Tax=Microbacterium sp. NIBRBAC000506063 TaxID=2734618 RepID=UPI001BB669D0|nr:hypothetical protein [Microbacterium sp. NIBRBAC000506063]QTV79534.1 hypothetical protein KAE78_11700 [Microbacterium sp. NIBRBAC000506063]
MLDPALTTEESMEEVLMLAETLAGYAGAWLDQSPNPLNNAPLGEDDDENLRIELSMNDPELLIINVKTTGDVARTESALRDRWGGMLCVSAAERSESELRGIVEKITAERSDLLSSWPDTTTSTIHVEVIFDNGSIQQDLDERYGVGAVQVSSALLAWP